MTDATCFNLISYVHVQVIVNRIYLPALRVVVATIICHVPIMDSTSTSKKFWVFGTKMKSSTFSRYKEFSLTGT